MIWHGSRSGIERPLVEEFDSTRNFAAGGANGLGWNATIGEDAYSVHMAASSWGWSAREHSPYYIAIETANPNLGDLVTARIVKAAAHYWRYEVEPVYPGIKLTMSNQPTHAELPAGIRDGKTDCYQRGDSRADDLRRAMLKELYG